MHSIKHYCAASLTIIHVHPRAVRVEDASHSNIDLILRFNQGLVINTVTVHTLHSLKLDHYR